MGNLQNQLNCARKRQFQENNDMSNKPWKSSQQASCA